MLVKLSKFFVIISVFLLALAACSFSNSSNQMSDRQSRAGTDKELTFLFNFSSNTMDPHLDMNYTAVRAGVGETLVKIGEDLIIKPWLAKEWKSEDGQIWMFTIKENVTFQNGKKVDANAVKASLEITIQENKAMKNALKIKEMQANGQVLTITTEEPFPQFPSELVHPNTAIIDVNELNVNKKPIGTGPFKVISFELGSKLELERYEDYWNGKAKLKRATFAFNEDANARVLALQAGDADIIYRPTFESIDSLKNEGSFFVDGVPSLRTHQLLYNWTNKELRDVNVRKALDALIDRQEVVEGIMNKQATISKGPFLSDFPFASSYSESENGVEAAKKYLKKAGYEIGNGKVTKNGKTLSFSLVTYNSLAELPLIAQVLQSKAKELGVIIDIQQIENIDEYLMEKDDWDVAIYSLITAPRGDASYYLSSAYLPKGALNTGGIENRRLISLIEELNRTVNEEKRTQLAKKATMIINQQMFTSSIVHPNNVVAYNAYVQNWVTSKSEYYMLTKELDVRKK